jgi:hypothetical protein
VGGSSLLAAQAACHGLPPSAAAAASPARRARVRQVWALAAARRRTSYPLITPIAPLARGRGHSMRRPLQITLRTRSSSSRGVASVRAPGTTF